MKHLQFFLTLCIIMLASIFIAQNAAYAESCCDVPGDANDDGSANVSDAVYIINYVFIGGPVPACHEKGDANCDASINVSDAVWIINYVFIGGRPPCCMDVVFKDEYGSRVTYLAFDGSFFEAVQVTTDPVYTGTQALDITIPDASWSGGAFVDTGAASRDLSAYNALTFWAKASMDATLDVAGIANDNTGTSQYIAEVTGLALTTTWQQYVIPIPLAEKLNAENGLFYFAEGAEEGVGYQIHVDEIVFDSLTTITDPRPVIPTITLNVTQDDEITFDGSYVTFDVDGTDIQVNAMMDYFTFTSSNEAVVSVGGDGVITAVGPGTAELTAVLGTSKSVPATGIVTVNVSGPEPEPATPAPTPTVPSDSVVALWSDAYTSHPVDTWSAVWDDADVEDYLIGTDSTKKYTNLVFAGIEFTTTTLDASAMTHFHIDVWTPNSTASPNVFKVKLVDFGPDGAFGGGDDSEHELIFDENTMNTEEWVSIDIPLASFASLTSTGHLAQMVISSVGLSTVYIDNIYFYDAGLATEPETAAPTPTQDPGNVASLYSDAYTPATTVDTWSAPWDQADVSDFNIGSDNMKKYTNLVYAGIEFTTSPLDASAMTHFHMDVWTPDPTDAPNVFKVKLVDFGPDGAYGGGDDVEHELTFDENTMNTAMWVGIDVPLANFTNLVTTEHLAQIVITSDPNTVFVDNIYFYQGAATEPASSAPTPTDAPADVFSVFSDTYTSTDFDTWSSIYDNADVSDFSIGSDNIKKYTNLVFSIAEYEVGNTGPQDLTGMTHFHIDVWTPDPTDGSSQFKIKLVDFGADGAYGGGDDAEHELTFDQATMSTGSWVSFDIPLADFTGLTTQAHFAQLILSGTYGIVFVDNVYFHK
ncbi:MAG: hypothetical protein GF310_06195 [candidate division Zixibacteria bacterium]|nr:hypothetical protein [candidate division Zixibacteria bacterium]